MPSLLSRVPTNGGQAAIYPAAHIDGRALNRLLRGSTASQRAIVADNIRTERLVVSPLTARQSRLLTGASAGYTYTASKCTEAERAVVKLGQRSLSAFHNKPSAFAAMTRATNEVLAELGEFEDISVGDLLDRARAKIDCTSLHESFDRLAARYPNQMMAALDRHTAPTKANGKSHANDNHTINGAGAEEMAGQMALPL